MSRLADPVIQMPQVPASLIPIQLYDEIAPVYKLKDTQMITDNFSVWKNMIVSSLRH